MKDNKVLSYISDVIKNMPNDWLTLTTHRLDIYNEDKAKTEFTEQFSEFYNTNNSSLSALKNLPTAYDYIRLGHPLSSILEWTIAKLNHTKAQNIISFSSQTMPILAILRKNFFLHKNTQIVYFDELPQMFDADLIKRVYKYQFDVKKIDEIEDVSKYDGSTILLSKTKNISEFNVNKNIDFSINNIENIGSVLFINKEENEHYISEIQHVRRRETISMTPINCFIALHQIINQPLNTKEYNSSNKVDVLNSIKKITKSNTKPLVGSSGLSIQYAIMMGLIEDALMNHKGKKIKFIVPPNCYGGTNDQARRVAACSDNVDIVDLPVDDGYDMVRSIDTVLNKIAKQDAVPYIIAEIPTNPRVEVPDLNKLREVLSLERKTENGKLAIAPVFILDQTFCPNVNFLEEDAILASVKSISYASGSKFPSGGKCTAGYCVSNNKAAYLIEKIEKNLIACDNEATKLQYEILANQLPSMEQRIFDAYKNTRDFVNFINKTLPKAKINFVSEELAEQGFTPSVFSLDLPTKGNTPEEKETYKRALNHKLINLMISEIPNESKYCVSYGQLKGCYWTIPATSTQGTTKEGDKDYIARVSVSPNLDLEHHKKVFLKFIENI